MDTPPLNDDRADGVMRKGMINIPTPSMVLRDSLCRALYAPTLPWLRLKRG